MAEPKTRPTDADPDAFLAAIPNARRRADALDVDRLMRRISGEPPVIWGTSIVGYGELVHRNAKGKEMNWPVIAFAPRSTELVLYLNTTIEAERFAELGPHRRGVGCLYIKRLADVDAGVLAQLVERSVELAASGEPPDDRSVAL